MSSENALATNDIPPIGNTRTVCVQCNPNEKPEDLFGSGTSEENRNDNEENTETEIDTEELNE